MTVRSEFLVYMTVRSEFLVSIDKAYLNVLIVISKYVTGDTVS
jgi:hypothetical protein